MDKLDKPSRYYELEAKRGKLNKLADINLVATNHVYVKIKFEEKSMFETIDVRLTVAEFKKKLEKFVGHPSNKFRLYYIDVEAMNEYGPISPYGPEELKFPNRCLHSFNIRDGDEFDIDLKPQNIPLLSCPSELMSLKINNKQKSTTRQIPRTRSKLSNKSESNIDIITPPSTSISDSANQSH